MKTPKFFKTNLAKALLVAIAADILPSPADWVHFWLQNWLYVNHTIISKGTYLFWQITDWYFIDSAWFVFLLLLAWLLHIRKKKTIETITIIGIVISIGAVIGIIAKFIMG